MICKKKKTLIKEFIFFSLVNIQFSVAFKPLMEANVNTMEENKKYASEYSLYLLGYMTVQKVYILTYIHL